MTNHQLALCTLLTFTLQVQFSVKLTYGLGLGDTQKYVWLTLLNRDPISAASASLIYS